MKNLLIALGVIVLIAGVGIYFLAPSLFKPKGVGDIKSFEDCVAADFLVVETQPRECHTKSKQVFVEVYNGVLLQNAIKLKEPAPNQQVESPFKLEGEAIGNWYFNSELTAKLMDDNGKVIATKQIKARSSTNTTEMVPFVAAITYEASEAETEKGRLVIEKTNPNYNEGETGPLIIPLILK